VPITKVKITGPTGNEVALEKRGTEISQAIDMRKDVVSERDLRRKPLPERQ
jgi:DNA-binding protein